MILVLVLSNKCIILESNMKGKTEKGTQILILESNVRGKAAKCTQILILDSNMKGKDADNGTRTRNPSVINRMLYPVSGQKTPRQNPPDINLWTKTPWIKNPLAKNLPEKTPQRKLMNTKYILHK